VWRTCVRVTPSRIVFVRPPASPSRNPNLDSPHTFVTKIFSGVVRSRWTIPFSCAAAHPCRRICNAASSRGRAWAQSRRGQHYRAGFRLPAVSETETSAIVADRVNPREDVGCSVAALPAPSARTAQGARYQGPKDSEESIKATSALPRSVSP